MVQGPSAAALEALRDASASIDEQIALLRQLKNDIVGHQQRKELVVKQAAVEPIVNAISTAANAGRTAGAGADSWSAQDEARLQATLVLGSLAAGGPSFMPPLLAANVQECLLSTLPATHHPKHLEAALQALRALAQQSSINTRSDSHPRVNIIDRRILTVLESIIRKRASSLQRPQLFHLATDIIIAAAVDETTRMQLLESGVWSPLLSLYARTLAAAQFSTSQPGTLSDLSRTIAAINAIIDGSNYRVECFVHDPAIRAAAASESHLQHLPQIHVPPLKHVNFHNGSPSFPALASLHANGGDGTVNASPAAAAAADALDAHMVCLHVLSTIKFVPVPARLHALRLLAFITNAIDGNKLTGLERASNQQRLRQREKYISICAVPVAVRLIQTACEKTATDDMSVADQHAHRELKSEACDVLARLIWSSKELQVAAVDSGAIKRVCPILKKSFDNVTSTKPMWPVRPLGNGEALPAACRLGGRGMSSELGYAMLCRRGALEAIAALAGKEDVHRQALVQSGAVACIIDSLKPFSSEAIAKMERNGHQVSPKDGNTTPVIIAACHAAQSMSRSVSLLRTSLIDAGIAQPIFDLLKHSLLEVQIAATEVCCNLVLEFSPMRENLLNAGVIKTLTEHARQSEMALRLSSLWALKHLVLAATREIKVQVLEELGVGWLVAAVQGEQPSEVLDFAGGGVSISAVSGLSAPNAAGERVDLLNPSSMDVDDPPSNERDFDEEEDGEVLYDESSSTHYRASHLRSTLSGRGSHAAFDGTKYLESLRDLEQNAELRARRDDVAVQEQGLDFIRNLLNGDDCAFMLEHLLNQVSSTQVFALLTEKLTPLSSPQQQPSRSSMANMSSSRTLYQPSELILATVHVITHISNGSPQQKNLLVAQKPLLHAWLPHFSHHDRRVRCISVWAVNSLTWIEDEGDRQDAKARVRELKSVGIVTAVEGLRADGDLDVRERVRVAIRQLEGLG